MSHCLPVSYSFVFLSEKGIIQSSLTSYLSVCITIQKLQKKREGCLTSEGTTTLVTNQQWLQEVANPLPPNVVDSQSLAISKKGTCLMACQSALSGKRGSSYVIDHSEQTWTCQRCYSRLLCPDHSVWVFFFFKSTSLTMLFHNRQVETRIGVDLPVVNRILGKFLKLFQLCWQQLRKGCIFVTVTTIVE